MENYELEKLPREALIQKVKNLQQELEKLQRERQEFRLRQNFSYQISKLANFTKDLTPFCKGVHHELNKLIACKNFYIALYDENKEEYYFPYHKDEKDVLEENVRLKLKDSLTDYVRRTKKAALVTNKLDKELKNRGEVKQHGKSTAAWLGAPLYDSNKKVIGVVSIQDYHREDIYNENHLSLLKSIAKVTGSVIQLVQSNNEKERAKNKAENSDRLKSEFLANVSHEIRTPMNSIMGFSSLLISSKNLGKKAKYFCDIIIVNSNKLLKMINDILEISKIESRNIDLDIQSIDLNQFLKEIYVNFTMINKKAKVSFQLDRKKFLSECIVKADSHRLMQIINNLLTNALKFTEEGVINFGYQIKDREILFYVKDQGVGIHKDFKKEIFTKFFQIKSESLSNNGSGLGLSIVKSLVNLMDGKIWVENNRPKGSIFKFTIPYQPVEKAIKNEEQELKQKEFTKTDWKDKTILVVDDEPHVRELFNEFLLTTKVNVLIAENSEKAEQIVQEKKVHLIFMDSKIRSDKYAGLKATKTIKAKFPDIPIVIQTAYVEFKKNSIDVGSDDFVTKPLDFGEVYKIIEKYLK